MNANNNNAAAVLRCIQTTKLGRRCRNHAVRGEQVCGIHRRIVAAAVAPAPAPAPAPVQNEEDEEARIAEEMIRVMAHGLGWDDLVPGAIVRWRRERAARGAGAVGIAAAAAAAAAGGAAGGRRMVRGELANIAADHQGVHRAVAVQQTIDIAARIRSAVQVPPEYQWHETMCSKTPGEIIAACGLSIRAAMQMMEMYTRDTAIYDIEPGIYGKVLDSVWQFVKGHAEKESLVKILRVELQDNIGMCGQGNLTRICNVLAGYMEGVGSQESVAERLGRLLPGLMGVEDPADRIRQANAILKENNVPAEEWAAWIEPLTE